MPFSTYTSFDETVQVEYQVGGDRNSDNILVCIAGTASNYTLFRPFLDLQGVDLCVVAIDLPGKGNSGYFKDFTLYNNENMGNCTLQVIQDIFANNTLAEKTIYFLGRCVGIRIGCVFNMLLKQLGMSVKKFIAYDGWVGDVVVPHRFYEKVSQVYSERKFYKTLNEAIQTFKDHAHKELPPDLYSSEIYWETFVQTCVKWDEVTQLYTSAWDSENITKLYSYYVQTGNFSKCETEWAQLDCSILLAKNEQSRMLSNDNLVRLLANEKRIERTNCNRNIHVVVVPIYGHMSLFDEWTVSKFLKFLLD